jgi:hypothetical protein
VKPPSLVVAVCLALALASAHGEVAQPVAPAASGASAPAAAKPGKRPLTADELRESGTFPGDLRPEGPSEGPVKPQIKVPLGKKPPAPSEAVASAVSRDTAASPTKINDQVARCKGQSTAQLRAACARQLAASDSRRP